MKVSASSSIFLATLALSSSSSCLAAPAGDPNQTTLSASSTTTQVSSTSTIAPAQPTEKLITEGDNIFIEERAQLLTRDDGAAVNPASVIPIVKQVIEKIINNLSSEISNLDSDKMVAQAPVQAANVSLPAPVPSIAAVDATPDSSSSTAGPNASSSVASEPTQAVQDVDSQSSSASVTASSASMSTASPQIPGIPPNTPTIPPNTPTIPIVGGSTSPVNA